MFAGYATLISALTATDQVTVSDNVFVAVQILALIGLAPFALTRNASDDEYFAKRVSVAFLAGQTLSALVAVLQLLGQTIEVPGTIYGAVYGRAAGLAEHPTTLGLMSCIAVLVSLRILFTSRRFRILVLVALAANLLSLVASGSLTSAVMGLAIGLLVLVFCEREHLGRMLGWGVTFVVLLAVVFAATGVGQHLPSLAERYDQVTSPTEAGSWNARTLTFDFAWNRIMEDPVFGEGLSAKARGSYNGVTTVHNSVLRAWYQGGVILGIAYGALFFVVLVVVIRSMARRKYGGEASVMAAIFAYAMVSPLLEQRHLWLPVLICWASISRMESAAKIKAAPSLKGLDASFAGTRKLR
ncbi:O-antigen ligase family protein [Mycolicibacterium gilvum]|uniref:O-antigen ligase family protein n=1 Tax=Mycolicibacterium gilvum TaxID=1804 RepID=UPI0021F2EE5D|nr:O-antigen ligase family protein [Mycolicibacterium gilvum]MCV7056543.1 O-antigen ligase family protein [Mycolicibacterium gilvum]